MQFYCPKDNVQQILPRLINQIGCLQPFIHVHPLSFQSKISTRSCRVQKKHLHDTDGSCQIRIIKKKKKKISKKVQVNRTRLKRQLKPNDTLIQLQTSTSQQTMLSITERDNCLNFSDITIIIGKWSGQVTQAAKNKELDGTNKFWKPTTLVNKFHQN